MSKLTDEQPTPTANTSRPTWDIVQDIARDWRGTLQAMEIITPDFDAAIELALVDMAERDKLGRERYGTPLQPRNGRDSLVDLYQELLDATVYAANDAIEVGVDPALSQPAYCAAGGLMLLYGCTYAKPDDMTETGAYALARFWKCIDVAVSTRMEIAARERRAKTASAAS